ncbi:MAG: hypothetical protein IJZ86_01260 [Bacteroides sp.]|nr:hypothetical protein [Bacteroides sp.]
MSLPQIQLSDRLQETIAFHQEDGCAAAKERVKVLDGWMTIILNGHFICGDTPDEKLKLLQAFNEMKQDYQSFIVE